MENATATDLVAGLFFFVLLGVIVAILWQRCFCSVNGSHRRNRGWIPILEVLEGRTVPSTFTVTNASADPTVAGSLPYAVNQANAHVGLDYILFDIPNASSATPATIALTSPLTLTDQVVIDGTSEPGYSDSPLIVVQSSATSPVSSLFILQNNTALGTNSGASTIQGFDLFAYTDSAISIQNASQNNFIQNNYVGFVPVNGGPNSTLNTSLFNAGSLQPLAGIRILSSFNTVRDNVVSGNRDGIVIGDLAVPPSATITRYMTNSIQSNLIGTDVTGSSVTGYGNLDDGILLVGGAQLNFVGPYNTLSGNAGNGVGLRSDTTQRNCVFKNFIGTDASATMGLGNAGFGVLLDSGTGYNEVGGPLGGNWISDNALGGVVLGSVNQGAFANWVQNNIIGLNGNQTAVLGSQAFGVYIQAFSSGNVAQGNVIAGNTYNGVNVINSTTNAVNQNWIGESSTGTSFSTQAFGIVLMPGASYNFILGNMFGGNKLGNCYIDSGATGNDIM